MADFYFKKKYGQNFLRNTSVVNSIVEKSEIPSDTLVLEVGPGQGALTCKLAEYAKQVVCYEIDSDLETTLINLQKKYPNVHINFGDFLDRNIGLDIEKYDFKHVYFISNVPYYITTPILMKLMDSDVKIEKVVMMVQKEVGERFSALPGSKNYSSITVFLNYFYNVKKLLNVGRNEFYPVPNVDSEVICFELKDNKEYLKDDTFFFKLVRDSFKFKRKTIRNNLKNYDLSKIESVLKKYNFDLSTRAEQLPVSVFVELSNELV